MLMAQVTSIASHVVTDADSSPRRDCELRGWHEEGESNAGLGMHSERKQAHE